MKDKFLLVDGNSLAYRAYYAMPFLTSPDGENTGAIFGFLNMLIKTIEDYDPKYVAVAFDFSKKTFRNEIFKDYKGTRQETPPELKEQFPKIKELLKKMNIKIYEFEGIEADDILGTLSKATKQTHNYILSGDRDLLQLINSNTEILLTKHGTSDVKLMNIDSLQSEMNLTPSQIVDLKSLMGDTSDNIPGVKGIGPKTAQSLIDEFGNLDNIYKNIDNIKLSLKNKLVENKDDAFMSYKLAEIKTDCDIKFNLNDCKLFFPFNVSIKDIFKKYGFNSLLKRNIFTEVELEENDNKTNGVKTEIKYLKEIDDLKINNKFAFNFNNDFLFANNEENIYFLNKKIDFFSSNIDVNEAILKLKNIFEEENILKITSDLKSQLHIFEKLNIKLNNVFDLKLGAYLIGGSKNILQDVNNYFNLYDMIVNKLKQLNMENLYYNIEFPLLFVLYKMEKNGFKINYEELKNLNDKYIEEIKLLDEKIQEFAGEDFNVKSPKQVAHILFDKLKLKALSKKQSTNIDVLNDLVDEHPIIPLLIRFRKIQKLQSTYIEPFLDIVKENGDIIHTIFNQTLTATGRLSSSEPNLQNIPVRDEEGKVLRRLFISRFENGNVLSADYNQIELRLLAHYSDDDKLIKAYKENKDIHTLTASQVFGVPECDVTPLQRRRAKAVNFGIIYGISDFGLSQNINLSRKEAKEYIEKYFQTYPAVKKYMDDNVSFAKENGYIKTIMGRIRNIPEINSNVYQTRQFGERVAMNMPLQGSASDIIKMAMIKVDNMINNMQLKSKLVLQIHDELIVDVYPGEEDKIKKLLKDCMENVIELKVPLPVDINIGKTWFDCK